MALNTSLLFLRAATRRKSRKQGEEKVGQYFMEGLQNQHTRKLLPERNTGLSQALRKHHYTHEPNNPQNAHQSPCPLDVIATDLLNLLQLRSASFLISYSCFCHYPGASVQLILLGHNNLEPLRRFPWNPDISQNLKHLPWLSPHIHQVLNLIQHATQSLNDGV